MRETIPAFNRTPRCLDTFCCEAPSAYLELVDGRVAVAQPVEQLDAHRLAQHAETAGDEVHEGLRKRVGHRGRLTHDCHNITTLQLCA